MQLQALVSPRNGAVMGKDQGKIAAIFVAKGGAGGQWGYIFCAVRNPGQGLSTRRDSGREGLCPPLPFARGSGRRNGSRHAVARETGHRKRPCRGKAFGPAPSGEGGRRTARAGEGARDRPRRGRQAERPRRRGRAGPATMEEGVREPPCPGKGTRKRPRWENGCGSGQCGRKRAGRTTRNAWVEEGGRDGKGGGFRSGECAWTGHMVRPGATAASGTGAQAECRSAGDPPRRSGNDVPRCRLQRTAEAVGVAALVGHRPAALPVAAKS